MAFSQPIEVWGTFSVVDHCRPQPFVAELMLYDRLVIPVPPKDEPSERRRWTEKQWDPDRLDRVIDRLGELAIPLEWNEQRRKEFRDRQAATAWLDPYFTTSLQAKLEFELGVPKDKIPTGVSQVRPVTAYDSPTQFERDVHIRVPGQREEIDPGRLAAILGRAFLVPQRVGGDDLDNLSRAVEIARDPEFREKRGRYHAWLENVIRRGLTETSAVLEMGKLVEEYNAVLAKRKLQSVLKYAFFVTKMGIYGATAAAALAGISLGAVAPVATAAVLLGEFTSLGTSSVQASAEASPAAMFYDARKHFGWS